MSSYFSTSDFAIMGGKVFAEASRNKDLQNSIDAISLGCNTHGYMHANNKLQSLKRQFNSYEYRTYEIRQQMDHYRNQRNKHLVLGVFDIISLLCRNLKKH